MDKSTYLKFYSLNTHQIDYNYEFLKIKIEKIFFQSFTPTNPIGTVFVVHGYLDHSGSMSNLINYLTQKHYQVMAYDLQGHGLSTGERATIRNFSDYVDVFQHAYQVKKHEATGPIHVVAHSTGAAIVMDYLLQYGNPFDKVISICPLVRSCLDCYKNRPTFRRYV